MKRILLWGLLLMLAPCFTGFSQGLDSIFVQYSNPGINQASEVVVKMYLPSQGAIRFGYSTQQLADTLFVTICYSSGPKMAPMLLHDTLSLGTVPANIQKLRFRAYYSNNPMQCDSSVLFEKTVPFLVRKPTGFVKFSPLLLMKFYPNPVQKTLQIENESLIQISLRDLSGKLISTRNFLNETSVEINVSSLPTGIYLLEVIDKKGNRRQEKLLKN